MFKVIKKQVRPNTSVEFYTPTDNEFKTWLAQNYFQTGKMLPPEVTVSEDGLEQSATVFFESEEAAREWKYDPVVVEKLHTPFQEYCEANGIQLLPTITIGEV
jgi:hypothetical protein